MEKMHSVKAGLSIYRGAIESLDIKGKSIAEVHEYYKVREVDAEFDRLNKINREMHDEISKVRKEKHYLKLEIKALRNFIKDIEGTA